MEFVLRNKHDILQVQDVLFDIAEVLKDKPYVCEIKPYAKKRSLDANAFFHVQCDLIAKATKRSPREIKIELNTTYGTIAKDDDGQYLAVMLPENAKVERFYDYAKWYKSMEMNGKKYNCYLLYKPTHELDSREMSALIDGTIQEAQQLGIEVKTPSELAEMEGYEK